MPERSVRTWHDRSAPKSGSPVSSCTPPKLFRSGKFRELRGADRLGHVFEEAFDFGKLAEFVHASGAATDFAGSQVARNSSTQMTAD